MAIWGNRQPAIKYNPDSIVLSDRFGDIVRYKWSYLTGNRAKRAIKLLLKEQAMTVRELRKKYRCMPKVGYTANIYNLRDDENEPEDEIWSSDMSPDKDELINVLRLKLKELHNLDLDDLQYHAGEFEMIGKWCMKGSGIELAYMWEHEYVDSEPATLI